MPGKIRLMRKPIGMRSSAHSARVWEDEVEMVPKILVSIYSKLKLLIKSAALQLPGEPNRSTRLLQLTGR